jgi:alpha-methylacyl-CoA racemase
MAPGRGGPLADLAVIEMAGLGPAPFAALLLSEMGASVLCIERIDQPRLPPLPTEFDLARHGRAILRLDLKRAEGVEFLVSLMGRADVLIEGFRPGTMERLGLGPAEVFAVNPALVYGRVTGFGQDGPLSSGAGHDLTYLAWSGVLSAIGEKGRKPAPPLNLVADYGGGAMFLIAGVLAALVERQLSGKGQVVDAAMVDGASMLAAPTAAWRGAGLWREGRGGNLIDGGAPFYDTYETADGGFVAVACLEPKFFAEFARLLPLEPRLAERQYDREAWPEMRESIAARLRERSRDAWEQIFAGSDACVAPVLTLAQAAAHPANRARRSHVQVGPLQRPSPAPRLSRTGLQAAAPLEADDRDRSAILAKFDIDRADLERLAAAGSIVG